MAFVLQPHNTPLGTCTMGGPVLAGLWFFLVCALGPKCLSRVNLIYICRTLTSMLSKVFLYSSNSNSDNERTNNAWMNELEDEQPEWNYCRFPFRGQHIYIV